MPLPHTGKGLDCAPCASWALSSWWPVASWGLRGSAAHHLPLPPALLPAQPHTKSQERPVVQGVGRSDKHQCCIKLIQAEWNTDIWRGNTQGHGRMRAHCMLLLVLGLLLGRNILPGCAQQLCHLGEGRVGVGGLQLGALVIAEQLHAGAGAMSALDRGCDKVHIVGAAAVYMHTCMPAGIHITDRLFEDLSKRNCCRSPAHHVG